MNRTNGPGLFFPSFPGLCRWLLVFTFVSFAWSVPPHQGLRLTVWHPSVSVRSIYSLMECSDCHGNWFFPSLYNRLSIPVCRTSHCDFVTAKIIYGLYRPSAVDLTVCEIVVPMPYHFGGQPMCVAIRQLYCTGVSNPFVENMPTSFLGKNL